jgi:thiol-disulfide isomerase/thioredoxin
MLCLFGVCIPYSMIWPVILLALREIYYYFFGKARKEEGKSNKQTISSTEGLTDSQKRGDSSDTSEGVKSAMTVRGEPMGTPIPLDWTADMDWNEIISCDFPVFVRFTAPWCRPCKATQPLFDELCAAHDDVADFINVNIDEFEDIAAKHHAIPIPTIICFIKGEAHDRIVGKDDAKIRSFIAKCIQDIFATPSQAD